MIESRRHRPVPTVLMSCCTKRDHVSVWICKADQHGTTWNGSNNETRSINQWFRCGCGAPHNWCVSPSFCLPTYVLRTNERELTIVTSAQLPTNPTKSPYAPPHYLISKHNDNPWNPLVLFRSLPLDSHQPRLCFGPLLLLTSLEPSNLPILPGQVPRTNFNFFFH